MPEEKHTHIMQHLSLTLPLCHLASCHPVPNRNKLPIDILKAHCDIIFDGFLDLFLDETGGKWANELVDSIRVRLAGSKIQF